MEDLEKSLSNINKMIVKEEIIENEKENNVEEEEEEKFSFYREFQVTISPTFYVQLLRS